MHDIHHETNETEARIHLFYSWKTANCWGQSDEVKKETMLKRSVKIDLLL